MATGSENTPPEGGDIAGGPYRIGCALLPKKESRYLTSRVMELASRYGMELCVVEPHRPLGEQGRFDAIIHKLQMDAEWENNLREYTAANPDLKVIDDIECIRMVRNRSTMLSIIGQEGIIVPRPMHSRTSSDGSMSSNGNLSDQLPTGSSSLSQPHNNVDSCSMGPSQQPAPHPGTCVLAPVQVTLREEMKMEDAEQLLQEASLSYPLLVKPQWADGRQDTHMLALVHDQAALGVLLNGSQPKGLSLPLVVQQFIEHGDILHKVYVVGSKTLSVQRPSLSLCEGTLFEHVQPETGLQILPRVSASGRSPDTACPKDDPPEWFITGLSNILRERLGLQIFNFDLICPKAMDGVYYVVDINYFPGVDKIRDFEHIFVQFLLAACQGAQESSLNMGLGAGEKNWQD